MTLSVSAAESVLIGGMTSAGFVLGGEHSKAAWLPAAIAEGVINELLASGKVTVPSRAGGTYAVSALSQPGMESKIKAALSAKGVKMDNPHCKAAEISRAVSKAICSEIMAKLKVSIPTDGSGTFQLTGLNAGALQSAINAELSSGLTMTGQHAKGSWIGAAVAPLCGYLNSAAVVMGSFTSGGVYPVK
jgi:hypothetical protein